MTVATALYARISKDSEGRAEGVRVQETKGRKLATERWPDLPVRTFIDNDISAADPDIRRPAYEEMLAAIRRGEVAQVVCAEQSRLTRQPSEWEDLVIALTRAGIDAIHCYRTGSVEVRGSRLLGRILAAVDAEEVERTRTRVNDRLDALAADGRPAGGGKYGYSHVVEPDGRKALVINEEEAQVIRWAAGAVLSGWSATNIARKLSADGVPTKRGGSWGSTTVRTMLLSPTVAALRLHRGRIVGPGHWEPILDEPTWQQVRAVLTSPTTVRRSDGGSYVVSRRKAPARRYLLTGGIAVCGRCGAPLVAQQRQGRTPGSQPSYLCHPLKGGCSGIGILAEPLEAHVVELLLAELETPSFLATIADRDDQAGRDALIDQLSTIDQRRADAARRWATGGIDGIEWEAIRGVLDTERASCESVIAAMPLPATNLDLRAIRSAWDEMTLEERRHVIAAFIKQVVIHPAKPGCRKFDAARVVVDWRI